MGGATAKNSHGSGRVSELDGLRGIAILAVVFYHYFQALVSIYPDQNFYPYSDRIFPWAQYGYLGVHLFFIISGFVIAYTLERMSGPAMFLRHRFFRLWPTMLVASVITYAAMHVVETPFADLRRVDMTGFLPSLTFTAPWVWKPLLEVDNYIDGAYWSLFVEVRFYFWALVIATLFGTRYLAAIMVSAVAMLVPLWHLSTSAALHFYTEALFFVPYLPLFAAGVLAYEAFIDRQRTLALVGLVLVWPAALSMLGDTHEMAIVTVFFITFATLIVRRQWLGALAVRPLVWIGSISYALYLLHGNLGLLVLTALPVGWPLWGYVAVALALIGWLMGLSWVVSVVVERPAHAIAHRFDQKAGHT